MKVCPKGLEVIVHQRLEVDNALGRTPFETTLVHALSSRELPRLPVADHERTPGRDQVLHALLHDLLNEPDCGPVEFRYVLAPRIWQSPLRLMAAHGAPT